MIRGAAWTVLIWLAALGCAREPPPESLHAQVVSVLGGARRVRPRFTGFEWAPCAFDAGESPLGWSTTCGEAPPLAATRIRELRAALLEGGAAGLHARAVWKAHFANSEAGLRDALLDLRQATNTGAGAWNDLGAVHFLLYGATGSADELASALEAVERALEVEEGHEEAAFNRALILQVLGLAEPARAAWQAYLPCSSGRWASEARSYLSASASTTGVETAASSRQRAQAERLLAEWARLGGRGAGAAEALAEAGSLGAAIAAQTRDRLLLDSVRFAQTADGPVLDELVRAHRNLEAAREGRDYAACAAPELPQAAASFALAPSPFGVWVEIDQAICDFFSKDFPAARGRLRAVLDETSRDYPLARARALWILGLVELRAGNLPRALDALSQGRDLCIALREAPQAAYLESLIARALHQLAWERQAWLARTRTLAGLGGLDPERRFTVLDEILEALLEDGRTRAARAFQEAESVAADEAASTRGATDLPAFVALQRWESAWLAGASEEARIELARASAALNRMAGGAENRERIEREIGLARAWTLGSGDEDRALGEILAFYERHADGEQLEPLRLLQIRVAVGLARGQAAAVRPHLEGAIRRAEAIADLTSDPDQRRSLERRRRWLFERAVELDRSPPAREALLAVVRLQSPPEANEDPMRAAERLLAATLASLPADASLLVHFAGQEETLGWLLARDRSRSWRSPTDAPQFRELASAARVAAVAGDAETFRRVGERLGEVLLPPAGWGAPGRAIFVLRDDPTHDLPFGAIIDPATSRPLLADHEVTVLSRLGPLPASWRGGSAGGPSAVGVVAGPDLDPARFPGLPALPFARSEGERIAALYPRAERRIGGAVTEDMLDQLFRSCPVMHLATHLQGPGGDGQAGLVLGGMGDDAVLTPQDVRRLALAAPLVVLAACRSGAPAPEDPGSSSLADAFLDAASETVVASLWPVDDRDAGELFVRFHEELRRGQGPAAALRTAQLALREQRGDASLASWTAFEVLAGVEASNSKWRLSVSGGTR